MATAACAHCHTPIVDPATMRRRGERVFCCGNCVAADEGRVAATSLACTHCGTSIVDPTTEAEVDQQVFCCLNCAEAHAGLARARGSDR